MAYWKIKRHVLNSGKLRQKTVSGIDDFTFSFYQKILLIIKTVNRRFAEFDNVQLRRFNCLRVVC